MKKYPFFFFVLVVLPGIFVSRILAQGNSSETPHVPYIMLNFTDADKSDHFRSSHLAERFKMLARSTIPSDKNSWLVRIDLAKEDAPQKFSLSVKKRKHELQITVPLKYDVWKDDFTSHNWLMTMLLLAQLGESPDNIDNKTMSRFRNHWIVRGMARKAGQSAVTRSHPFLLSYPAAYSLTANGIYPGIKRVVNTSPAEFQITPTFRVEAEYAELLVEACATAGFFRKKSAEPLLRSVIADPGVDHYKAFVQVISELKLVLPSPDDYDAWFSSYLRKSLLSFFSPMSTEQFETEYRTFATIKFKDSDNLPKQCRLTEIAKNKHLFDDWNGFIDKLIADLNVLSFQAPGGLQKELADIRICISRLRTDTSPEAENALKNAEFILFEHIARLVETDRILKECERNNIPIATRFEQVLNMTWSFRLENRIILPDIQRKLDKWDEYR